MDTSNKKGFPLAAWRKEFPMLVRYSSNLLLMKQDIALVGLQFQKVYNCYRPLLVAFPLWEEDTSWPIFMELLHDKRKLTIDIPFEQQQISDAIDSIYSQYGCLLTETVKVKDLFMFLNYKQTHDMLVSRNYYSLTDFLIYKMVIAIYLNDSSLINEVCLNAKQQIQSWGDIERFESQLGKLADWESEFYNMIDQRDEIMERIRINSMDKRIVKLKESHLVL